MKKNSHKRWSFFLCLLMVLSLTAVGCEKKCSDDEIFVPDQEQTEGEGDAADTQDTANAEEQGEGIMRIAVTYENGQIFQHCGHTETFKTVSYTHLGMRSHYYEHHV